LNGKHIPKIALQKLTLLLNGKDSVSVQDLTDRNRVMILLLLGKSGRLKMPD
jgi:hypothetical protein